MGRRDWGKGAHEGERAAASAAHFESILPPTFSGPGRPHKHHARLLHGRRQCSLVCRVNIKRHRRRAGGPTRGAWRSSCGGGCCGRRRCRLAGGRQRQGGAPRAGLRVGGRAGCTRLRAGALLQAPGWLRAPLLLIAAQLGPAVFQVLPPAAPAAPCRLPRRTGCHAAGLPCCCLRCWQGEGGCGRSCAGTCSEECGFG